MPQTVQFTLGGTLTFITEPSKAGTIITLRYEDFTLTARGENMAYTLPVAKQVRVQVSYVDAGGNPATIDGEVSWASSDETIAVVIVDTSNTASAVVRSGTKLGQVQITATADADLGEGTRAIITPMDVSVVAGEAVAGTITPVGEAEDAPHIEHHR
jgi:hypothetical protein